ncbi:N-acetylmuramoyl-L-alanine amidase [Sphingomonas sp. MG17]|uniref:N-acetylmuramoyl-L-alanine amidase n=1 Tax=Sphingomonas tagetis TaxID=2949092 RepID=A0A9X2KLW6_9SPHN|nr:N-acetylmuramoyl-L-alanine amidase [Sphingomonas tagetis]MCP3731964.1 N-acetylmuramoyl-L-alanine amidase [Sphingomonas tagetis]
MLLGWTLPSPARHIARVSFFLALLAGFLTGAPSWAGTIRDIDVQSNRVVIRFDQRVAEASSFVLAGPNRIALDLIGAKPGARAETGGPVTAIRQAARGDGARVVFDLARPAIVSQGSFASDGATLTLELRTVDDARFARAAAEGRMSFLPPFSFARASTRHAYSVSVPVPARAAPYSLPRIYGSDDDRPLVVIDAGHGGHDPGSVSAGGVKEKDVALRIAKAIRDELVASGRARVALTREDDRYLLHRDRFEVARKLGAALFISVHCDAAHTPDATGATVYTLSEVASDKEAARLAARENKSDILAGIDLGTQNRDVSSILIDLTQRETMNASAKFARLLGREAQGLIPVKPNYHRMASLLVLKAPDMPSILFETGYISNESDVAMLNSTEGRRRIAQSVERAVAIHFATRMASR